MTIKNHRYLALATSAIIMVAPVMVLAVDLPTNCNQLLKFITGTIATTIAAFIGAIAVVMVLVGAFQFLTAGGDAEKVKTARSTILWAIVGFAVALIASSVQGIVTSIIGSPSGGIPGC